MASKAGAGGRGDEGLRLGSPDWATEGFHGKSENLYSFLKGIELSEVESARFRVSLSFIGDEEGERA